MLKRYAIKVEEGSPRWQIDFDLRERVVHVYLENKQPEGSVTSADGLSTADFAISNDGLPYILGVTMRDPNKFSLMHDWIEEAIEGAMDEFNVDHYDDFANNHWKGVSFEEFYGHSQGL